MATSDLRPRWSLRRRLATAAVLMVLAPTPRLSAQQAQVGPCEAYGTHPVTFVGVAGEPIRRSFTVAPDVEPVQFLVTPMTIERSYRGADASVLYVKWDGLPPLEQGRRYLIYGDNNNFGAARELITPGATPKNIEQAADELAFLDAAGANNVGGVIYGTLTTGRTDGERSPRVPVAGVTIRFNADGFTTEAITDDRGRFTASSIPEGRVWIQPLLPDGWLVVSTRSAEARSGGCTPVSLVAELNGRIRGRVAQSDGTPVSWLVDLIPVDPRAGTTRQKDVRANERGEFEFTGLQPGAYLVGFNLLRPPDAGFPYPATFHPSTTNRDEAVPIVVGAGTVHEGVDVVLSSPIPTGQVDVRVQPSASPRDTWVCVGEISRPNGGGGAGYQLLQPGEPVTVRVVEGEKYRIAAHVDRPDGDFESDVVEVTGTAGRQLLTLRANTPVKPHPANSPCYSAFSR